MPFQFVILSLAAAASSAVPVPHHFGRQFVSPMGEPFFARDGADALQTWFGQADKNHDGILSLDEMQADAERFFGLLDTNHDGEIDPDEINHYELDIAPGNRTGLLYLREPVVAADTNFNRGVSLEEFRQAASLRFKALDTARQGQLTLVGLEAMGRAAAPREKQKDAPVDMDPHAMDPQQH